MTFGREPLKLWFAQALSCARFVNLFRVRHLSPSARHPHNVGFDHRIVGTADKQEVLDVVSPQQHKLPTSVEIEDIHNA